jgi:hypothetical protein
MPCESGKHDGPAGTTYVIRVGPANLTSSWRSAIYQHGALHAFYCSLLPCYLADDLGANHSHNCPSSIELSLIDPQ